jgi:glycine cleavage system aminomethyltransferase T
MTRRGGRPVPAHYGSAAAELSACMTGAGLAHRPDLDVLTLSAPRRGLDQLMTRVLGLPIAPGGAVPDAGAWWCRPLSGAEVVVVCPHDRAGRLESALARDASRLAGGTVSDVSGSWVVLQLVGRRAGDVLCDLGVYGADGDPASTPPFAETLVGGHPVGWVLERQTGALALVEADAAAEVWQAIAVAGRPHGLSCAGLESVDRYLLVERAQRRTAPVP